MSLQDELKKASEKVDAHITAKRALDVCISDGMAEMAKVKQQIADAEVTYSIGDRFTKAGGAKYMLVNVAGAICHVGLDDGYFYNSPREVKSVLTKISVSDYDSISSSQDFTRCWDNRLQQKVSE